MHSAIPVPSLPGSFLYVSHHVAVRRLVVFVHGFMGKAIRTWRAFPAVPDREWWHESDMLFFSYRSTKDTITGVAARLRRVLPAFYPLPNPRLVSLGGVAPRDDTTSPYVELVLVAHSLGGVIVRRALCDAAEDWNDQRMLGNVPKPFLLDAKLRLFSPASAGFRAAGFLGMMRATSKWDAIEMFVRRAPAYSDLQPGSKTLVTTQRRTEALARDPDFGAQRARILWASPDNVVASERYDTDYVDLTSDGHSHSTVCKPSYPEYEAPWTFVELGEI
jgi:pimeloyl-ACP methyl ester carboxylesterase